MKKTLNRLFAIVCAMAITAGVQAQETIETRVGNLSFTHDFDNGYPTEATVDKLFDQLDFRRACQMFLRNITGSSMYSFRQGLARDIGVDAANKLAIWEGGYDATSLLLTPNSETLYRRRTTRSRTRWRPRHSSPDLARTGAGSGLRRGRLVRHRSPAGADECRRAPCP